MCKLQVYIVGVFCQRVQILRRIISHFSSHMFFENSRLCAESAMALHLVCTWFFKYKSKSQPIFFGGSSSVSRTFCYITQTGSQTARTPKNVWNFFFKVSNFSGDLNRVNLVELLSELLQQVGQSRSWLQFRFEPLSQTTSYHRTSRSDRKNAFSSSRCWSTKTTTTVATSRTKCSSFSS